jgi:(p)ppGpp synthase/HD superfamily hydrolase
MPYIVHPVAVAMLIARHTDDEDVVAAALLHDILEDTKYGKARMKKAFGVRVIRLVEAVSDKRPNDPWAIRKETYLKHIAKAPKEACLVSCADKIHNLHSIVEAYKKDGDRIWKNFNASKEAKLEFYGNIYKAVKKRFRHPLIDELGQALKIAKKKLYP